MAEHLQRYGLIKALLDAYTRLDDLTAGRKADEYVGVEVRDLNCQFNSLEAALDFCEAAVKALEAVMRAHKTTQSGGTLVLPPDRDAYITAIERVRAALDLAKETGNG